MVAYWVSRGRPDLYIRETLMAASACPFPPGVEPASTSAIARKAAELSEKEGEAHGDAPESPKTPQAGNDGKLRDFEEEEHRDEQGVESVWPRMLASAVDHPDDHFAKVRRLSGCSTCSPSDLCSLARRSSAPSLSPPHTLVTRPKDCTTRRCPGPK